MPGKVLTYILFFLSATSSLMYFLSYKKEGNRAAKARKVFFALAAGIIVLAFFFLTNIFAHNFQYSYIWENSSADLPPYLLFASFFAGQQGSFLLWLTLYALVGFPLVYFARKYEQEPLVLGFYSLFIAFLLLLLIVKSPFEYIWDTYKNQGVTPGFTPPDGKGLNPILENLWITIHPPILFLGYTLATVPFILAVAGLIRKDYKSWIKLALPWTLLTAAILGLGISLGGFWAYETLGWGGFWGWDPVENSSLLPWLCSMALIHTIIVQMKTGALAKTNLILSISLFSLVLFATFLTRSGVLSNTSVHSFTDPGNTVHFLLSGIFVLFTVIGLGLLVWRARGIKSPHLDRGLYSRGTALTLGSVFLIVSAVIVLLGTTFPLISDTIAGKKISMEASFFNNWNFPLALLILVTNAISLLVSWKSSDGATLAKKIRVPLALTVLSLIILLLSGISNFNYLAMLAAVLFSIFINLRSAVTTLKKHPLSIGGFFSHSGVALLMTGIIATGGYTTTKLFNINIGETKNILGYNITLKDKIEIEKNKKDRQKFIYRLLIEKNGSSDYIDPVVYWSDFNQRQSPIIEPGIKKYLLNDVYVTLKSAEVVNNLVTAEVQRGVPAVFPDDTTKSFELAGYDMAQHQSMRNRRNIKLGAILRYYTGENMVLDTLYTTNMDEASVYSDINWKSVPGTNTDMAFLRIVPVPGNIGMSEAVFAFKPTGVAFKKPDEVLTLEAANKPFINFVWLGVIMIAAGFGISVFNHLPKKELASDPDL